MVGEVGTVFTQSCRMNGVHHVVKDQESFSGRRNDPGKGVGRGGIGSVWLEQLNADGRGQKG